jgi:hypothetical protein
LLLLLTRRLLLRLWLRLGPRCCLPALSSSSPRLLLLPNHRRRSRRRSRSSRRVNRRRALPLALHDLLVLSGSDSGCGGLSSAQTELVEGLLLLRALSSRWLLLLKSCRCCRWCRHHRGRRRH